jgi:uncharacterized membrane protein
MVTADAIVAVASTVVWLGTITATMVRVFLSYRRLPERFPLHLSWTGELDGVGSRRRFLQLALLPAIFIPILAIVLSEDTSVWTRATGWHADVLLSLGTIALAILATLGGLTLVNTLAVTQAALGTGLTQRQAALYMWTMRIVSLAGVGVCALIAGMAYETYNTSGR